MQKCFVLDLNKCTGCHSCKIACKNENDLPSDINWRQVVTFNEQRIPGLPVISYSIACNHCIDAPCKVNCPALAYKKDEDTGIVSIDKDKCMGCNYCQWVCPYDAPAYNDSMGIMQKCTMCSHRKDVDPACVIVCPTGALKTGDYEDKYNKSLDMTPDIWRTNIEPALLLKPLKEGRIVPGTSIKQNGNVLHDFVGRLKRKRVSVVSLASEWPLLVFTMGAPLLVAAFSAFTFKGVTLPEFTYVITGIICLAVSTIHLGQKLRFYRSIINWKRSWLSKEIIFFTTFYVSSSLYLLLQFEHKFMLIVICLTGFAALYSMDKVYLVDSNPVKKEFHSAFIFLTGLYLTAVFVYEFNVILLFGALKAFLYLKRKIAQIRNNRSTNLPLFFARTLTGFILPAFLILFSPEASQKVIVLSIFLGEVFDRAEFYRELEFMRPQTKACNDLEEMVSREVKALKAGIP